jgi:uncharacterized Zn finger protein
VSGGWRDWGTSTPRRVEGGIRAKSKRGSIGEQWWSRRFIAVLESYGLSGRLTRGRSYARAGQVLEFTLAQGKVTAKVQGSRPRPYQVHIGVVPLSKAQWREVSTALASQALFRARLLAGEMPHEIEDVFAACGTPLFPRVVNDLDMRCSCPDWEVPCKHLAAVCYVLAEAFDEDPFAMLAWRGKGRDELLAALRSAAAQASASSTSALAGTSVPAGTSAPGSPSASGDASAAGTSSAAALALPASPPLAECLDSFWAVGLSPARLRAVATATGPATAPDLLLRMFEPPPVRVRNQDFRDILAPAYARLAEAPEPE